jgi:hypothetical protein
VQLAQSRVERDELKGRHVNNKHVCGARVQRAQGRVERDELREEGRKDGGGHVARREGNKGGEDNGSSTPTLNGEGGNQEREKEH